MPEEIDLNEDEEAALDAAWEGVKKLPPPSRFLKDDDQPNKGDEAEPSEEKPAP